MEEPIPFLRVNRTPTNNIIVENAFYRIRLDSRRGASLTEFSLKKDNHKNIIQREGCEIWSKCWGQFHQQHYQQELGGRGTLNIKSEKNLVEIIASSKLGNHSTPHLKRGQCENKWGFYRDNPLITCDFKIAGGTPPHTMFKKYVCFPPGIYSHWAARKRNDDIVFGQVNKTAPKEYIKILKNPLGKWITFFGEDQGFALIMPDEIPKKGVYFSTIWRSREMLELLYYCICGKKQFKSSINYLGYLTTPKQKWMPIEKYL